MTSPWQPDMERLSQLRDQYWQRLNLKPTFRRFDGAIASGEVRLPVQVLLRCAYGHRMLFGDLQRLPTEGRTAFIPDHSFLAAPTNGVWVWQNGDNADRLGPADVLWGTLRIRLACPEPGCTYSPEMHTDQLTAIAMDGVLSGDFQPIVQV